MTNSIIEAISTALNGEFGDGYEIHMEELEQGLEEPCFFVFCLDQTYRSFPGKRYFQTGLFCIQYFPATREGQRECNDVAERMYRCLEYVTVAGDDRPVRGTGMKCEVVDGVLNFFVQYDHFVVYRDAARQESMEGLETRTDVKGGG